MSERDILAGKRQIVVCSGKRDIACGDIRNESERAGSVGNRDSAIGRRIRDDQLGLVSVIGAGSFENDSVSGSDIEKEAGRIGRQSADREIAGRVGKIGHSAVVRPVAGAAALARATPGSQRHAPGQHLFIGATPQKTGTLRRRLQSGIGRDRRRRSGRIDVDSLRRADIRECSSVIGKLPLPYCAVIPQSRLRSVA